MTLRRDPWQRLGTNVFADQFESGKTVGTLPGRLDVSADGAATYHIPIWVPSAPLQPALALEYNSRNDSSFTGVGFRLGGIGEIARCKAAYAQDPPLRPESSINFTTTDHLCLNGRILISTSGTPWTDLAEFRPDDDPYTRVRQHVSGESFAEVFRHDGTTETYGQTSDSVVSVGTSGAPQFSWGLNKRVDRSTNVVTYTYRSAATPAADTLTERLPDAIDFGSTVGTFSSPYSVVFQYQTSPDPRTGYVSGYKSDSTQLLSEIQVFGPRPSGVGTPLGKDYRIVYDTPTISKRALIKSVQECDRPAGAAEQVSCKPPTTFSWEPGKLEFQDVTVPLDSNVADHLGDPPPHRDCNPNVLPIGCTDKRSSQQVQKRYLYLTTADTLTGTGGDDIIYRGLAPGSIQKVGTFYQLEHRKRFRPGPIRDRQRQRPGC